MNRLLRTKIIFAATLALCTATATAQETAEEGRAPPPPAWVNIDGSINIETAPKEIEAVDAEGALTKDSNGRGKMVPTYFGETPPKPLRTEAYPQ